ncbi:MAG: M28 family peptidase [Bacteroidota bacterium]
MMEKASESSLHKDVEFLTSLRPFRNYKNPAVLKQVVTYLREEFSSMGFSPVEQKWMAEGTEYTNVIASYDPENSIRLIVGAHYDVCDDQPGADDNASAVAGLLETARLVSRNQPKIPYGIDFVSYCLEEPPFFGTNLMGSYVHAKSLKEEGDIIRGMVCYEMIGYFSDEPHSQQFPLPELASQYPNTGDFIVVVGLQEHKRFTDEFFEKMSADAEINVQKIVFEDPRDLAGLSDHRNYWKFGFPALMINDTSFLRNPNYHKMTDTIETLDFPKMKAVVDGAYKGITGLSV